MKAFLVERPATEWCQDYAMVVVAEDELRAERKARLSSDNFRTCKDVTVEEIEMDKESVILIANTGA